MKMEDAMDQFWKMIILRLENMKLNFSVENILKNSQN